MALRALPVRPVRRLLRDAGGTASVWRRGARARRVENAIPVRPARAARDDPEATERFLCIMASEAERITRLINELLTLSKVETEEHIRP